MEKMKNQMQKSQRVKVNEKMTDNPAGLFPPLLSLFLSPYSGPSSLSRELDQGTLLDGHLKINKNEEIHVNTSCRLFA